MKNVILLGRTIQLAEITKAQLKGITIGDALSYTFYSAVAGGVSMVFVEPKKNPGTPRSLVFLQNIIEYAQNSNTFFFDLEDISNYGVKDNTIVLLDYGMTQYIYDYYWHKELKLDKNFL